MPESMLVPIFKCSIPRIQLKQSHLRQILSRCISSDLKKYFQIILNPFVALCKFEENISTMSFENCNLFQRSYTTLGIGYTFNNENDQKLFKKTYRNTEFSNKRNPSMMRSTNIKHSLAVVIDSNTEEIYFNENSLSNTKKKYDIKEVAVSLHNPKEIADTKLIPLTSTRIPLGHSTTFLISAKGRKIDESGEELSESQRGCRLDEETESLEIFNVYSRIGCLFECKMKYSIKKCGCTPWYHPINMFSEVGNNYHTSLFCKVIINLSCIFLENFILH